MASNGTGTGAGPGAQNQTDADIALRYVNFVALFGLVFGLAATVHITHFRRKFKEWRGLAIGLGMQFFLMPLVGFAFTQAFASVLRPVEAVMMIVVFSSPGGSYSNLLCSFFNADLSLSVAMTTVSTIAGAAFLPLNIFLYVSLALQTTVTLDWVGLGTSIGIVIGGVVLGLAAGTKYPQYADYFNIFGQVFGLVTIIVALFGTTVTAEEKLWEKPPLVYLAVGVPGLVALLLAFGLATLARLEKPERVAIAIEGAYLVGICVGRLVVC